MTDDQIFKLRESLNLIAQIFVVRDEDDMQREKAYSLIKEVVDGAKKNPFTKHWKEEV